MKNLIRIEDLSRKEIMEILELAKSIEKNPEEYLKKLETKSLATLFFQPSTRTRVSSSLAMQRLGGSVVDIYETKFEQGMGKEESFSDTIKVIGDYVNLICLRHNSEDAPFIAERNTNTKIINCGNGKDQHPTQALLDLYTIWEEIGRLDNLKIAIVGDLKNSRSAHSLLIALSVFDDNKVKLISPENLKMPEKYFKISDKNSVLEIEKFEISNEDVVYMCGFSLIDSNIEELSRYDLTLDKIKMIKEVPIILTPLPRITEIHEDVDSLTGAKYFKQSKNGVFVRMAILLSMLGS